MTRCLSRSGGSPSRFLLVCGAFFLALGCGARSTLEPGEEPCAKLGNERPCADACGVGVQVCSNGFWQACQVPQVERACSDDCGTGSQTCSQGAWSTCVVPNAQRGCTNDCGSGVQRCSDSKWGVCEVPKVNAPCEDFCGVGQKTCADNVWGVCVVPPVSEQCESVCGVGKRVCQNGAWVACDAPQPKPPRLAAIVRDFRDSHPDFERPLALGTGLETGLVGPLLDADETPIYLSLGPTRTTSGPDAFAQWYHDVPGVNASTTYSIQTQADPNREGFFVYDNRGFFPIDGQLFGNQGRPHNFHFTLATKLNFRYLGGEVFRFRGDDDLWVFVNRHLAIDLGGLHESLTGEVLLDEHAKEFGIEPGQVYPLHLFFAERHTIESNFSIETSIADPGSCE